MYPWLLNKHFNITKVAKLIQDTITLLETHSPPLPQSSHIFLLHNCTVLYTYRMLEAYTERGCDQMESLYKSIKLPGPYIIFLNIEFDIITIRLSNIFLIYKVEIWHLRIGTTLIDSMKSYIQPMTYYIQKNTKTEMEKSIWRPAPMGRC